eukprot:4414121-Lingulodinium_polyedra.AAC.1
MSTSAGSRGSWPTSQSFWPRTMAPGRPPVCYGSASPMTRPLFFTSSSAGGASRRRKPARHFSRLALIQPASRSTPPQSVRFSQCRQLRRTVCGPRGPGSSLSRS